MNSGGVGLQVQNLLSVRSEDLGGGAAGEEDGKKQEEFHKLESSSPWREGDDFPDKPRLSGGHKIEGVAVVVAEVVPIVQIVIDL